jgi:hypothetical protein
MSNLAQEDSDKTLIKAIVNDFHAYFSSPLPLTKGSCYTLLHGLIVVPLPPQLGGLKIENFADMYERVSPLLQVQYDSGVKSFLHRLAEPEAEIWVSGGIAAVLVGWSAAVDGRDIVHTINLCSLYRIANENANSGNPWRISGLVDMKHFPPEIPLPLVEAGPVSDIIAPFETLLAHIKGQDWEAIPQLLLPGGGATISQGPQTLATLLWPEFINWLQADAERGPIAEKKLVNCEARRCGDLAFVWAPFMLIINGREHAQGVNICSFREEEGQWLISSLQEGTFNN